MQLAPRLLVFMIFQIFIIIFSNGIFPRVTMMCRSHQVPIFTMINWCLLMCCYNKIMWFRKTIYATILLLSLMLFVCVLRLWKCGMTWILVWDWHLVKWRQISPGRSSPASFCWLSSLDITRQISCCVCPNWIGGVNGISRYITILKFCKSARHVGFCVVNYLCNVVFFRFVAMVWLTDANKCYILVIHALDLDTYLP